MARPLYETQSDRDSEKEVCGLLSKLWKCEFQKLPVKSQIDFVATVNGVIKALVEIKSRNYSHDKLESLGGYMISIAKLSTAKLMLSAMAPLLHVPFILVLKLTDGVYFAAVEQDDFAGLASDIVLGGRRDRGDSQDVELCAMIPMSRFKLAWAYNAESLVKKEEECGNGN